jgi:hypothetical protein
MCGGQEEEEEEAAVDWYLSNEDDPWEYMD